MLGACLGRGDVRVVVQLIQEEGDGGVGGPARPEVLSQSLRPRRREVFALLGIRARPDAVRARLPVVCGSALPET